VLLSECSGAALSCWQVDGLCLEASLSVAARSGRILQPIGCGRLSRCHCLGRRCGQGWSSWAAPGVEISALRPSFWSTVENGCVGVYVPQSSCVLSVAAMKWFGALGRLRRMILVVVVVVRCRLNERQFGRRQHSVSQFFIFLTTITTKYSSLAGGSLGSWIDEDRSQMR